MKKIDRFSSDPDQRQRLAADPLASVWVSASAGTGKTKVLTDRVLSLLVTGIRPQRILCLTFTRAAAAEMESRISDRLGQWTMAEDAVLRKELVNLLGFSIQDDLVQRARQLFAEVLDTPGGMNIQTIHAFCQSLLGRFPLEAGVSPHFSLMEERDAEEMLLSAREELFNRARSGIDNRLANALENVTAHIHEAQFPDLLAELTYARGRLRRLVSCFGDVASVITNTQKILKVLPDETPRSVIENACKNENLNETGLRSAILALSKGSKKDVVRGQEIQSWLDQPLIREDRFFDYAGIFLAYLNEPNFSIRKTLITKAAQKISPGVVDILLAEGIRLQRIILHWRSVSIFKSTSSLLILWEALLDNYQIQKNDKALIDYDDLILMAGELLNREGIAPWVLFKLDGGIDHVLVDEAQDTSPAQWRVIKALVEEFFVGLSTHKTIRTIFVVGDVKQSIYSFQGADPITFGRMQLFFSNCVEHAEQSWRPIDLNVSFRSTEAILSAVDAVFASPDISDGVKFDGNVVRHGVWRTDEGGLVELWPPVEPRASDPPKSWKPPVERIRDDAPQTRLARLIAGRIAKILQDEEVLESKGRPIQPGDIMILVRRRTGFVEDMIRSLKELNIGVAGIDRMVLTEQLAVMDLIAFGQFLLLPEDDLTLANLLRSPLIGLTEEQLYKLAYQRKGSLWESLAKNRKLDSKLLEAHEELSYFMGRADLIPPFELFGELLGARNGRKKLVSRLGPDALDPISEFLNLALVFERSHAPSLEGFLHWIAAGAVEIKRDLEQAPQDSVRVMTVHAAKGLQAPIVFLPDTMQVPQKGPMLLWPRDSEGQDQAVLWAPRRGFYEEVCQGEYEVICRDRDQEYKRLLYVAMTRAEDRLYICGWKTKNKPPEHCWYNLIQSSLSEIACEYTDPYLKEAGETSSSVVLKFISEQKKQITSIGAIQGLQDKELPKWAYESPKEDPLQPLILAPSKPNYDEPAIASPLQRNDESRFKWGKIIHTVLQNLPDVEPRNRKLVLKKFLSRKVYGLTSKQQKELADEVLSVIDDSRFAPIFGLGSRAEVPLSGMVGGQIISAQLDRILVTENEVFVVDFKTNRPPPRTPDEVEEVYLQQMAAYRVTLQSIYPDKEIRCALLWTVGAHLMELEPKRLLEYEPKGLENVS
ncbi:MAG: double-strand break repair helicase AddA [Pseudomonadota bacterium]|nr:double-strand break repair helicase AddA [Pseudomonadota bacterium]